MILSPDHFLVRGDGTYDWSPSRVSSAWKMTLDRVEELLPTSQELVLLVGIPGAGKTTWLKNHHTFTLLYVDATLVKKSDRAILIQIAQRMNKTCSAVLLDTPFDECVRRNDLRSDDRRVPYQKMAEFQRLLLETPPTPSEGLSYVLIEQWVAPT